MSKPIGKIRSVDIAAMKLLLVRRKAKVGVEVDVQRVCRPLKELGSDTPVSNEGNFPSLKLVTIASG